MPSETPRFRHDCNACRFIGHSVSGGDGRHLDVYTCRGDGAPGNPTWIARYGDEPDAYASTLSSLAIRDHFAPDDGSAAWYARSSFRVLTPEWLKLAYSDYQAQQEAAS